MAVFELGGKKIQVDTYKTSWPWSVVYKRQGVTVEVNPESHWWCAWLCTTTDDIDQIGCAIRLHGSIAPDADAKDSCDDCGDLTVKGPASYGVSAPWMFDTVDFDGTVRINGSGYTFKGSLVF